MKGFIKKGAVIIAAGMLMTGCGDDLQALTESEEAVIVNYSAGTVAKFNKRQQDGLTVVVQKDETEDNEDITSKDEQKEESQTEQTEQKTQENVGQEDTLTGISQGDATQTEQSLSQALGIPGIEIKYTGQYEVNSNYPQLNPPKEGYTYLVMNFILTNTTTEEAQCNILGKVPAFAVSINGGSSYKNETTALANDLVVYDADLAAGTNAEGILVFQVPEADAANIASIQLQVQVGGTSVKIAL